MKAERVRTCKIMKSLRVVVIMAPIIPNISAIHISLIGTAIDVCTFDEVNTQRKDKYAPVSNRNIPTTRSCRNRRCRSKTGTPMKTRIRRMISGIENFQKIILSYKGNVRIKSNIIRKRP